MIRRILSLCLIGLLGAAFSSCKSHEMKPVYRVALRHIPESADPYSNQVNTDNFIMLQLYYPLFQRGPDGTLGSEFLDPQNVRAEDSSFRNFTLCLLPAIRFSDGTPISVNDLERAIREAHKRQELLPALETTQTVQNCLKVALKSSDPRYFEKLTGTASTITSSSAPFGGFPTGLGPYRVAAHSADLLILEANPGRVKGAFQTIEFRKYTDVAHDYAAGVFDFNHTGQVSIPENIQKSLQRVSRPFFKSYALVLNYPDKSLRSRFVQCFPVIELRSLIGLPLKATDGFLPSGIRGSDLVKNPAAEATTKACDPTSAPPMKLFNYRPELHTAFQEFLRVNAVKFPIPLRYEEGSLDEVIQKMTHEENGAAVIGFDSSTSDSSAYAEAATFFETFIRDARAERLISQAVPGLAVLVRTAAQSNDPAAKTDTYRKAHQLLLDSGYVVPLGQLDLDQFYPKTIQHIVWSDRISGFPDISLMETVQ